MSDFDIVFSNSLVTGSLNYFFFFFNDTATTEIYTLSLHDALPICSSTRAPTTRAPRLLKSACLTRSGVGRSEEHTSELQSPCNLVCRLLLEKKKKDANIDMVFYYFSTLSEGSRLGSYILDVTQQML